METKQCTKCLTEYPIEHFSKKGSGRSTRCSSCVAAYFKDYYHNNPDRKAKHLARVKKNKEDNKYKIWSSKYGITEERLMSLLSANKGKCVICNINDATCIDHCHTSGEVRGALCAGCNTGLGMFKDNTESLLRAVDYLRGVSPHADNVLKG